MERNQRQYKDLLRHLRSRGVPRDLAEKAANIVASEDLDTQRSQEEQRYVSEAWAIANKIDLSSLESLRGE